MKTMIAILLCSLALGTSAAARTWRVEKDGSGDYTVIQDALDAAASGDTVLVGPGRFEDFRPYTYPGGDYMIIANVEVGSMTIIGAGRGNTILGPTTYPEPYPEPHTVGIDYIRQGSEEQLRVSNLTLERLRTAVYVENSGRLSVDDCEFNGGNRAVTTYSSSQISNCAFEGLREGIYSYPPADSVVVDFCTFNDSQFTSGVQFQLTPNGIVRDCTFIAGPLRRGGVAYDRSGGGVYGSRFEGLDRSIAMSFPYLPEIMDNDIQSHYYCIDSNAEAFIAERNYMSSEAGPVIRMSADGLPHRFWHNHIIRGTNLAVDIYGCNSDTDFHLDMSENWWGTTDADSISAWIHDGYDGEFPPLECYVDFEPFLDAPVPAEKTSLGGLKALFR